MNLKSNALLGVALVSMIMLSGCNEEDKKQDLSKHFDSSKIEEVQKNEAERLQKAKRTPAPKPLTASDFK